MDNKRNVAWCAKKALFLLASIVAFTLVFMFWLFAMIEIERNSPAKELLKTLLLLVVFTLIACGIVRVAKKE